MGRNARPWYYEARDTWVVWRDGKKVPLAKGKGARKEAVKAFHALMAAEKAAAVVGLGVRSLVDVFLEDVERKHRPLTLEFYRRHCLDFWKHVGVIGAAEVRPMHVSAWLASHAWGPTTQHGAIAAVKRMFRWARKQGYLDADPLEGLEKPRAKSREAVMTPDQVAAIMAEVKDRAFRDLLTFVAESGCRPSEAMAIGARHLDCEAGVDLPRLEDLGGDRGAGDPSHAGRGRALPRTGGGVARRPDLSGTRTGSRGRGTPPRAGSRGSARSSGWEGRRLWSHSAISGSPTAWKPGCRSRRWPSWRGIPRRR
jgi:integrase